ncbi:hypothetical protein GSI_07236 [Ganoderma sinense ZZ0214-1]|uniref:Uncharacterized protein n=1 Tax=Ganoderma sinense ZZ0214-1 TaxID=1077348 RepID=A0A2G8S9U7_9APHY|nr:hypothetical protein GSI_07236 [Ganoderma sinense ZZ0214-1]
MQRIRKISNDLRDAFLPKSGKPELRPRPSYRITQPIQTIDSKKTANRSLGYNDSTAVTTGSSREAWAERERRERDVRRQAMKPAHEQRINGSSVAFPSSSSHSKPRTKAQEKPVPVPLPSLNHKQAAAAGTSWDLNAGGSPPAMSPYRYALDPQTKPLPSPPGTLPARKPHKRPPYSPSRFFTASQSTPDVSRLPPETGIPTTRERTPASPDDTQGQSGTPSWPPEGPAAVKRQQRTPKSSIDSLYRSQTMKDLRTAAMTDGPRDVGHGHSRTASTPTTRDAQTLPRRREQQAPLAVRDPRLRPAPEASIPDDVSEPSVYSQSSYRTNGSSAVEPKKSLQVRELPTSRSVHVQSNLNVRRAASRKAQIVYPSYVTTPLPPLPVSASVPAPQPQVAALARRLGREPPAAPRVNPPPPTATTTKGEDESHDRSPSATKSRKQKQRIEIEYISMRQIAEMESEKVSQNLNRELAEWDRVNATTPNVVPAAPGPEPSKSYGGTRPLVVKKRPAFLGLGLPRTSHLQLPR